jgi:hypothetical protein
MNYLFSRKLLVEAIAGLFILLFVYTALNKLLAFKAFQLVLSRSPLIGKAALTAALLIPSVEILVTVLLFLPLTRKFGLAAATILMAAFAGYVAYMVMWVPDLPCSCGGIFQGMSWRMHLVFNVAASVLAFLGWRLQAHEDRLWLLKLDQSFIDKQAMPKT